MSIEKKNLRWLRGLSIAAIVWAAFWTWFGAVSGAEPGWHGLWRNLPNAIPWVLALAIAISTWRSPRWGGWALLVIGVALIAWVLYEFLKQGPSLFFMLGLLALPPAICGAGLLLAERAARLAAGPLPDGGTV